MPKIRILDSDTANKIAAGEVIERPLSVVKELVENALDAGADRIVIDIKDGGKTTITVSDNGCGMEPPDAEKAFLRHATSKISRAEDLFSISTLGFRGEALPSIAAVAKVTLLTRTPNSDVGVKIVVEGGTVVENEPIGCPVGTKVVVQDLFYNTPARKKHLKSAAAEAALISDMVSRLALSRPHVAMKLTSQNRVLVESPGTGKLLDAIAAVNGIQVARKMIPVEGEMPGIHLSGYVSKPELNRASRTHQTILINGRYVKSKMISDAIKDGYHTLMSYNRHPLAVLAIEVMPGMVDVNVHPTKMEVRISHERELIKLITGVVQKAVRTPLSVPQIEQLSGKNTEELTTYSFAENKPEQPASNQQVREEKQTEIKPASGAQEYTAENKTEQATLPLKPPPVSQHTLKRAVEEPAQQMLSEAKDVLEGQRFPELFPLAQLLPTYILAQGAGGLYIIDQHAAHERVLFERYRKQSEDEQDSQMLLVPVVLELSQQEVNVLTEHILTFRRLGFILEHFGGNTYLLRGVPAGFPPGEEGAFFFDVLDTGTDHFNDALAAKLACCSAIKAGQKLSHQEMQTLIGQMAELENPYTCPHGRPTMIQMSFQELAKRFKR